MFKFSAHKLSNNFKKRYEKHTDIQLFLNGLPYQSEIGKNYYKEIDESFCKILYL